MYIAQGPDVNGAFSISTATSTKDIDGNPVTVLSLVDSWLPQTLQNQLADLNAKAADVQAKLDAIAACQLGLTPAQQNQQGER